MYLKVFFNLTSQLQWFFFSSLLLEPITLKKGRRKWKSYSWSRHQKNAPPPTSALFLGLPGHHTLPVLLPAHWLFLLNLRLIRLCWVSTQGADTDHLLFHWVPRLKMKCMCCELQSLHTQLFQLPFGVTLQTWHKTTAMLLCSHILCVGSLERSQRGCFYPCWDDL